MNTEESTRQCGLILDMAEQNIAELEKLADTDEMASRTADMRSDLQEIWPLIENAPQLLKALEDVAQWAKSPDDSPKTEFDEGYNAGRMYAAGVADAAIEAAT